MTTTQAPQSWPSSAPETTVRAIDLLTDGSNFHVQVNGIRVATFAQSDCLDGTRWVDADDERLHADCVPTWEVDDLSDGAYALARRVMEWAGAFHVRNGHQGALIWCIDEECRSLQALAGRSG